MKKNMIMALSVSVLALTACSDNTTKVGSRDDIIIHNRGDAPIVMAQATPMVGAPTAETMAATATAAGEVDTLVTDEVVQEAVKETKGTINEKIEDAVDVATENMPSPEMPVAGMSTQAAPTAQEIGAPMVKAASEEVIVPVTTPSIASGDIVVEVPEAPMSTAEGEISGVSNIVTEHQGVDKYAPVQPTVTENQAIDTAVEAAEEIIEQAPSRVSPYVPTY